MPSSHTFYASVSLASLLPLCILPASSSTRRPHCQRRHATWTAIKKGSYKGQRRSQLMMCSPAPLVPSSPPSPAVWLILDRHAPMWHHDEPHWEGNGMLQGYWLVVFGRDARGRNPTFLWPAGVYSYVPSINVALLGLTCFFSWDTPDAVGYCIHIQDFLRIALSVDFFQLCLVHLNERRDQGHHAAVRISTLPHVKERLKECFADREAQATAFPSLSEDNSWHLRWASWVLGLRFWNGVGQRGLLAEIGLAQGPPLI
ncbi:uncharacterized protein CLUP02_17272 [Colletotrichum lupini]|uniref:Uncharacterized protein n=1 Tax=Colletotrichum lupini TaxID=145971 RepID=A0A9Q8SEG4_9PEZI|nr:uncharacterized protein CLUP02_17272 [Colletotrichum lupini]UQC75764.1 hypothetical protein CLUP02_17272 [Colletotrichum lupini]